MTNSIRTVYALATIPGNCFKQANGTFHCVQGQSLGVGATVPLALADLNKHLHSHTKKTTSPKKFVTKPTVVHSQTQHVVSHNPITNKGNNFIMTKTVNGKTTTTTTKPPAVFDPFGAANKFITDSVLGKSHEIQQNAGDALKSTGDAANSTINAIKGGGMAIHNADQKGVKAINDTISNIHKKDQGATNKINKLLNINQPTPPPVKKSDKTLAQQLVGKQGHPVDLRNVDTSNVITPVPPGVKAAAQQALNKPSGTVTDLSAPTPSPPPTTDTTTPPAGGDNTGVIIIGAGAVLLILALVFLS